MKHDWQQLKIEFFQSETDEVKSFLSQKWIKLNGWWIAKKTKGWWKEKQDFKDKILQRALEKQAKEEVKNLEVPIEDLKKAKKAVIWLLMKKLDTAIKWGDISVSEQERILKMIKTELWEPTNISKTDATIKWEPIDESLLIQN